MSDPKRLYKIEEGKKLCGVCGGVAEYLNMDPTIVRVLWAVISLFWGVGIVLYIVMALILPPKSSIIG